MPLIGNNDKNKFGNALEINLVGNLRERTVVAVTRRKDQPSFASRIGLVCPFHFLFDRRLGCSQNVEKRLEYRIVGTSAPDGADRQFAGRRSDWTENRLTVVQMANATRNKRYTQAALHGENDAVHHFQLKRDFWQETCTTTSGDHFGIK